MNTARTQENTDETQEAGLEPAHKEEIGDNVGVQDDKEVEPAPLHITDSVKNVQVKNI